MSLVDAVASEVEAGAGTPTPRLARQPDMTDYEPPARKGRDSRIVSTDGGEDDEPDWEHIARRAEGSRLQSLFEEHVGETFYQLTNAIQSGREFDEQDLGSLRSRYRESEEQLSHTLQEFGELDMKTPAERLATEARAVDYVFQRVAKSARQGRLCKHDLEDARDVLERAEQTLDSLEEDLEE